MCLSSSKRVCVVEYLILPIVMVRQNKYMKEYDEKAPSKYIMYLDTNNLYGGAMSQYLPTGSFRWLTEKEINKINLVKYIEDSQKGVILEVDLEYPQELHDLHNDYPLAPEKNESNKRDIIFILQINKRKIQYRHWSSR